MTVVPQDVRFCKRILGKIHATGAGGIQLASHQTKQDDRMSRTSHSSLTARTERGFTIIELMVVVALVGILAALALPSFQPLIERWRVRTSLEELQSSIYFARSEAIKQGGSIVIAKNDTAPNCVSAGDADWSCGWVIYLDSNRDGNQAACSGTSRECTIMLSNVTPNLVVTVPNTDNGRIFLNASGRMTNQSGVVFNNVTIDLVAKDRTLTDLSTRRLCISGAGRFKQVKGDESC